ncbi:major facilitator superfamily protein, putative [Ichthyophthirius multifiliis]|uniref:Major facilitator superfamily protein, putative n=1 Tax=Ichthyophthirius multifiliis TaxID=5932 RepID=G0QX24_ICHMU|nr:major facilitator superfamily protein, putative [Ichthyophthirius multifiliis]EGR30235.1 major facilitator superfamily protein, putative [Ichthyophthirius multifiliis]|eukprot:XP_004031831.1 major facilitator superfamily protein, putative [Ichthyophthirius multifiliis]
MAAAKEAQNTLIGVVLVKFGLGAIGIWGVANTYFFSYFLKYNPELKLSEFNFLVTVAAIPMIIITLFSLQVCEKYGFEKIIKITMIINPICVLIGSYQKNFYIFAAFNTLISSISFGITAMPMLYCLWSHFPSKTGNTTGIALASFGLATFFYSLIVTFIVNPQNLPANIEYEEGTQVKYYFNDIFAKQNVQNIQKINEQQMTKSKSDSHLFKPTNQLKNQNYQDDVNIEILNLKEAIKTQPFILIYVSTFFLSCFSLFISLNYKTYGLTKINDDHFLTYLISITTIVSSLSNILWGYLVDRYQFRSVYIFLICIILISGFIFPIISSNIFGFSIIYQILGSTERGLYTIIGPGLVQIYGIKLGSELFPIKSTSFFLALVLVPVIQVFLLKRYTYDQIIHIFNFGIAISLILSFKLKNKYNYYN